MEEKIRIENVTKKFGSYAALDGISLNFEKFRLIGGPRHRGNKLW